jgi:hypothetical protein
MVARSASVTERAQAEVERAAAAGDVLEMAEANRRFHMVDVAGSMEASPSATSPCSWMAPPATASSSTTPTSQAPTTTP